MILTQCPEYLLDFEGNGRVQVRSPMQTHLGYGCFLRRVLPIFVMLCAWSESGCANDDGTGWPEVAQKLQSTAWSNSDELLVEGMYARASLRRLQSLAASENRSLAIRAVDELYLRRRRSKRGNSRFVGDLQELLNVTFPSWLAKSITNSEQIDGVWYPELDELPPYRAGYTANINGWHVRYDDRRRVVLGEAPSGEAFEMSNLQVPTLNGHITGTANSDVVVLAIHGAYPDQFSVVCVDVKSESRRWTATCRDPDGIQFYSGKVRTLMAVLLDQSTVVVVGVSTMTMFIELLDINTGDVVGRYSSVL